MITCRFPVELYPSPSLPTSLVPERSKWSVSSQGQGSEYQKMTWISISLRRGLTTYLAFKLILNWLSHQPSLGNSRPTYSKTLPTGTRRPTWFRRAGCRRRANNCTVVLRLLPATTIYLESKLSQTTMAVCTTWPPATSHRAGTRTLRSGLLWPPRLSRKGVMRTTPWQRARSN